LPVGQRHPGQHGCAGPPSRRIGKGHNGQPEGPCDPRERGGEVEDRLAGEVVECVYSDFPGGCGRTEHCEACTIRNSLDETVGSGRSLKRVPAYQYIKTPDGIRRKTISISTEKKGSYVLLRIDDIDEGGWGITNRSS